MSQLYYLQNNAFIFYFLVIFYKIEAKCNKTLLWWLKQSLLCFTWAQPCDEGRQVGPLFSSLKYWFTSWSYKGHNLAKDKYLRLWVYKCKTVCALPVGYVTFILGDKVYHKCKLVSILGNPWSRPLYSCLCMQLHVFSHSE